MVEGVSQDGVVCSALNRGYLYSTHPRIVIPIVFVDPGYPVGDEVKGAAFMNGEGVHGDKRLRNSSID